MPQTNEIARENLSPLLADRWSPRAFSAEPVARKLLESIIEAARWAPSAYNLQPWRLIVWDRFENSVAFDRMFSQIIPFNQAWNTTVPIIIGVGAVTLMENGEPNPTAAYDAGAAALSICLQAHAVGLVTHQMAGFDHDGLRKAFSIPPSVDVMTLISVGYIGQPESLPQKLRERELAPRTRSPISSIAFAGEWGKSL